jgi:hypothetical protein
MFTMAKSSIQIDISTREKLRRLKMNSNETYDEVLNKLISLVPSGDDEGTYTDAFRSGLLLAKCDSITGRVVNHSTVKIYIK